MDISGPYLLFLGDSKDPLSVKTSRGIAQWRCEECVGEMSMPACKVTLGLDQIDFKTAQARGAKTFVLGLANQGGVIAENWHPYIIEALESGMDIASGLHQKIADIPEISAMASTLGRKIFDVRHPAADLSVGTGQKRTGRRILAVGTDCSVGKMYSSLALEAEMKKRNMNADFRATGQTGIFIAGSGISIDAVVADFISGAVEKLSPDNSADHWDIIEGQGSLFHPSFAGVSMGLLHGAQADVLILCHEIGRAHMRGLPHQPVPRLADCLEANINAARLTNSRVQLGGICVNSSSLSDEDAAAYCDNISNEFGVPCLDPLRHGVASIVDYIQGL